MTTQYTDLLQLPYWQHGDRNWDVQFADACGILDLLEALASLYVTPAEAPLASASLNVSVTAGSFRKSDGTVVAYAGTTSFGLTASAANYVYLDDAGTLTNSTVGWPAAFHVRLAICTTDTTTVTDVALARVPWVSMGLSGGTLYLTLAANDASGVVSVNLGTTNGTKLGSAVGQKLGFFGATPIVQPANTVELVALLGSLGLRATGGNPDLNVGTGTITCGALNAGNTVTITDAKNVVVGTTTGTKIGTAATQKLGFWGATPVVQPASANQAALGTLTLVTMTDSTTGTASDTLNDVTGTFSQTILNSNFASLLREINRAVADFTSVKTLVNQLRADLVTAGILKGSA